jgi:hypothetical protein
MEGLRPLRSDGVGAPFDDRIVAAAWPCVTGGKLQPLLKEVKITQVKRR